MHWLSKKTLNHIILKQWKEMDWELKCAEQRFGTKKKGDVE